VVTVSDQASHVEAIAIGQSDIEDDQIMVGGREGGVGGGQGARLSHDCIANVQIRGASEDGPEEQEVRVGPARDPLDTCGEATR
jgi:hypothetical protein